MKRTSYQTMSSDFFHFRNAFTDLNPFKLDDVEYKWKPSSLESFPDLFYGIAIYSDEKDDIQRIFDQQEKHKNGIKCNTDELLQFGTKEANEHLKRLIDSDGEQLFIDKDFFHFSPQGRDLYFVFNLHMKCIHNQII